VALWKRDDVAAAWLKSLGSNILFTTSL